jgi:hypothetical protein
MEFVIPRSVEVIFGGHGGLHLITYIGKNGFAFVLGSNLTMTFHIVSGSVSLGC